nr:ribonuclease H-like domain-containing protein [Tanacetum cinerariifolium]
MQRKKNDVKARTTLLLSLPDEHHLRFSKYKTAKELWVAILKTFGGNEATKKTKKNLLKQQYGNFKAEGSKNLEQTFNRLQDIPLLVVMAFASPFGFRILLLGKEEELESYMANDGKDHALVADEVVPTEFALMANNSAESKKLETLKQEKEGVDRKLAGLLTASKDLNNLIESQRSDKNKEGLGYTVVPPPTAQLYLSPKKDLSWTGLPECADDTVTDYSRSSPTIESTSEEDQNRNPSVSENVASPITPKPFIKFRKPKDSQSESKTDIEETPKKPPVKYAEQYNKKPNVRGNQRNWNNLKSHQLVRSPYRAPWVPTVNRKYPPVNRKFSTGSRNFPTANRKFPAASRKFPTGSTKSSTDDKGMKGKAIKPSACWF